MTEPINRPAARVPAPRSLVHWGDADLLSAWLYAEPLHRGQLRRYTGHPYVSHPFAVCKLLRRFGAPKPLQLAGMLHDVVEDCGVSLLDIETRFSGEVADLVLGCSRVTTPADGPRSVRHRIELQRIQMLSPQAQSILLADITCNCISIVRRDRAFARVYLPEKRDELQLMASASLPALGVLANRVVDRAWQQLLPKFTTPLSGRAAAELAEALDLIGCGA